LHKEIATAIFDGLAMTTFSERDFDMGLFWDLYQQSQISDQSSRSDSLEGEVSRLRSELRDTRVLLHDLIKRLEEKFGEDIDKDGRIG